ncbi:MAG: hypothetical protein GXY76_17745 [Chloroflexi bacterium]|nr:hypothetical protein [Chloroflexota bacterium]
MAYRVRPEATMGAYGDITTDRRRYAPLDTVRVRVTGRARGDVCCKVCVLDAKLRPYHEAQVKLVDNHGEVQFSAAGALGVQWLYLYFPSEERHSRYTNIVVDAETGIRTGNPLFDGLYPLTREALQLGRREFGSAERPFVGYISGDTWQINGVWLRDWIYQLPAYRYWEREMTCGLDRFLETQNPDGSMPDGIRRDGTTWRMAVESDVEYILVLGVYETWQVTGDGAWMAAALPKLERALAYIEQDEKRWDAEHQLVKRGHTCDTWDFEIHETADFVGKRFVAATCDQSGYALAYRAMAEMWAGAGDAAKAAAFADKAQGYAARANALLWDGVKYQHHIHLTPIEHPGFDETQQLAMGNTWAVTRGLADHEQAVSIISEYRRRHAETGDAYPWWSLQPGYPDELDYYPGAHAKQGGYANGGLMPWVGGELCRGAFLHGLERYGVELLRQYNDLLARTGNRVHVWYWPNGEIGFRTTNEVPYTGWGMAGWLHALMDGLAGLRDAGTRLQQVSASPRWAATAERGAQACIRYASNDAYFAYEMRLDEVQGALCLRYAGSGERVDFHVLCPAGWEPREVWLNGAVVGFQRIVIGESMYADFEAEIAGEGLVKITCGEKSE